MRLAQARFDDATADFEAMLRTAREAASPEAEHVALAGLCDTLFFARRVEDMAGRAQELLEVARRAGDEVGLAEADARIGQVLVVEGRLGEAAPLLDGAIAATRRRGPGVALKIALSYRGFVHYWQTEYEAAEATSVEALSVATELGDGFYALAAHMFLGLARTNLGRLSEAIDDFNDALAVARRNDDRYWQPRLMSHLGWAHRELGALDRAREFDTEAVRLARERPVPGPEVEVLLNLCVDDVRVGRAEQASALLAELHARAADSSWLRWLSELRLAAASAEHWAARGDHGRALEQAARLAEVAEGLGSRDYRCAAERIRAGAALACDEDVAGAALRLDATLAPLRRKPAPLEAWKAARLLGVLRSRLGEKEAARAAFAEAARSVRTIAAGVRDEALREGFLRLPAVREVLEGAAGHDG